MIDQIRTKLLSWFRREKRRLPWRGTRDPYRIWISEVMLQQTTVAAVASRYGPFLKRFPTLARLARSSEDSVLAAWSGLGYYQRARNLRKAARAILREHAGRIPRDARTLESLPGFGRYTAAALCCLAFGQRIAATDANVIRVISRLFAIGRRTSSAALTRDVARRVHEILPTHRPGDLTAALMDLGQMICLPRSPRCEICPLQALCAGRRTGHPELFPPRSRKPRPTVVHVASAVVRNDGRVLLLRRRGPLLRGLWEFPSAQASSGAKARRLLAAYLAPLGLRPAQEPIGQARHAVVHRRLEISVFSAHPTFRRATDPRIPSPSRWFRATDLKRAPVPTLTWKVAHAAGLVGSTRTRGGAAPRSRAPAIS